jgi:branched-chain amino acid transport system permease protein
LPPWLRLSVAAVLLALMPVAPVQGAGTEEAVRQCQALMPAFVRAPMGITIGLQRRAPDEPLGVRLDWRAAGEAGEIEEGWLICWFLPRASAAEAWQMTELESSKYGLMRRYDIQQLLKFQRLRPDDRERVKVDTASPWTPVLIGLQQGINGFGLGCIYALIALGFTLIYAAGRVINFAFGEIFALGAFLMLFGYLLSGRGEGWNMLAVAPAATGAVATAAMAGWAIERLVFRPLRGRGLLAPLVAAVGLSIVLQEAMRLLQGPKTRWLPPSAEPWPVIQGLGFDVYASRMHLAIGIATAVIAGVLWLLATRTRTGRAFRAAIEDGAMAALLGVDVGRALAAVFSLGAALAGLAGALAAYHYGPVDFHMGSSVSFKALTGAVVGGLGSVPGAFLGGFVVAGVETAAAGSFGGQWRDIFVFGLLILFLIFRPAGLLGGRALQPDRRASQAEDASTGR